MNFETIEPLNEKNKCLFVRMAPRNKSGKVALVTVGYFGDIFAMHHPLYPRSCEQLKRNEFYSNPATRILTLKGAKSGRSFAAFLDSKGMREQELDCLKSAVSKAVGSCHGRQT